MQLVDPEKCDSRLTAEQIANMTARNPAKVLSNGRVVLPPARGAFVELAEAVEYEKGDGKPQFSILAMFAPNADLSALAAQYLERTKEFFPRNPKGLGFKPIIRSLGEKILIEEGGAKPPKSEKDRSLQGAMLGGHFINPRANPDYPPELNVFSGGQVVPFSRRDIDAARKEFYGGAWYVLTVDFFAGRNPKNPGTFLSLASVTKVCDDNRFGGGGGPEKVDEAFSGFTLDPSLDVGSNFAGAADDTDPLSAYQ